MQGMGPMGGLGGMEMGGIMNNPEMMAQMMQSPIMQSMLNDPEMLRNMIQSTPGMSEVTFLTPSNAIPCL
jgi:ubiquilin